MGVAKLERSGSTSLKSEAPKSAALMTSRRRSSPHPGHIIVESHGAPGSNNSKLMVPTL